MKLSVASSLLGIEKGRLKYWRESCRLLLKEWKACEQDCLASFDPDFPQELVDLSAELSTATDEVPITADESTTHSFPMYDDTVESSVYYDSPFALCSSLEDFPISSHQTSLSFKSMTVVSHSSPLLVKVRIVLSVQ